MARILLADYPNPDGRARFRALKELGHDVVVFNTQAPTLGMPVPARARSAAQAVLSGFDRLSALLNSRVVSGRLFAQCEKFRPDILLAIKGVNLRASVLERIRRRVKPLLVNWYGDSLLTPGAREFVERDSGVYDFFFVIDDKPALERVKVRAGHVATLPFACDPEFHRPPALTAEERARYGSPVAFVGTVVPSRERVLHAVREFGLKIWGPPRNPWGTWDPSSSKGPGGKWTRRAAGLRLASGQPFPRGPEDPQDGTGSTVQGCRPRLPGGHYRVDHPLRRCEHLHHRSNHGTLLVPRRDGDDDPSAGGGSSGVWGGEGTETLGGEPTRQTVSSSARSAERRSRGLSGFEPAWAGE